MITLTLFQKDGNTWSTAFDYRRDAEAFVAREMAKPDWDNYESYEITGEDKDDNEIR